MMAVRYEVCKTEKVKKLNEELERELADLKAEVEENEMVHGIYRTISSVPMPKSPDYFKQQRQLLIDRALKICSARPVVIQADAMKEELSIAEKSDYTVEGLPLLLHQFFLDRINQLVQCKHMHMLRWKRMCEHVSIIEALYNEYQQRLSYIMSEYHDCIERAQRLSLAKECFATGTSAAMAVKIEDIIIYLRWLITHLHSVKMFNQYLRVLEWLPISHGAEITATLKQPEEEDDPTSTRIPSRYQDNYHTTPTPSRPNSAVSLHTKNASNVAPPPLPPPPVNPLSLSTHPLPASQFNVAASATGGGIASDEISLGLPLHYNDLDHLRPQLTFMANLYNISVDVDNLNSSADEMEMYAQVNRKFRQQYARQEHMKTFKTYDRLEVGQESWGSDSSIHALQQESNWLPFISLKPVKDAHLEKQMVELRTKNNIDELLKAQSRFIQISDPEKVQDALRQHTQTVRDPPPINPVSVTSNRTNRRTAVLWKRIYTNPELYDKSEEPDEGGGEDFDERDVDKVSFKPSSTRSASGKRRKNSYDYFDAVQLLGLDEGDQSSADPASIQGAFLSFLQLRHLRIRDLQRTCLSLLNYFRSVERTLTINDGGLSHEEGKFTRTSAQDHRKSVIDGSIGAGGGLGSHQYMHNTPKDFKISEVEFMEFSEIENHDDFYNIEEGRVHVQDQRGYYIVYEAAMKDYKELENDMLLIATHYIEKDRDMRTASGIVRDSARRRKGSETAGDFDIANYAHQEVDRFAVLLDMWTNMAAFLECKKELLDCYYEAYQHVFDRDEKRQMAQTITNVMYQTPRLDFNTNYFITSFRLECINLRLRCKIVKSLLDTQIEKEREYLLNICREDVSNIEYGMPLKLIQRQPISVNMSKSALKNVYLLEFHPSLAAISRIQEALKCSYWELHHRHKPESRTEMLKLEKRMLESAFNEWVTMEPVGSSFSAHVQREVFCDVYVENPTFMCDIASTAVHQQEQQTSRKSQRQKQEAQISCMGSFLQILTTRYKLIDAACESEILSKIYKKQAVELGYEECHLFLRFVQFEFASFKDDAGKPPPVFITAVQEDDSSIDRLNPSNLYLAIHELDEGHVGKFGFRNRDSILQLMRPGGMDSLHVVLKCQVVHKNALMSAIQQVSACQPAAESDVPKRSDSPFAETKSEKSSLTAMTGLSSGTGATALGGGSSHKLNKIADSFVSIQLEKNPSRDLMLNEFINKKNTMGTILRNPEEMEKLKRKLLSEYCDALNTRLCQYSLRGQLLAYYNSIIGLLQDFPSIRDAYFMFGEVGEKKTQNDDVEGLEPDPRELRKRPRRILSADGKHLLNIWFIPHFSETLIMFKTMDDDKCFRALYNCVYIVSALHDILQYLCAHARLGTSQVRMGSKRDQHVSADWGGSEGIGAELREIQLQIDNLEDATNPVMVAEFLALRRDVMFLEFDTAVRHSMREMFLSASNQQAYQAITDCMHFPLHELSNAQHPTLLSAYMNVPEPLEPSEVKAKELYPWRSYLLRNGPFPVRFWQWQQIDYNMQLCLAGLKQVDRQFAHGEVLGVSLLMEDVLMSGQQDKALTEDLHSKDQNGSDNGEITAQEETSLALPRKRNGQSNGKYLSIVKHPREAYSLLKSFLVLWKQLEVLKTDWGQKKLNVEKIDRISVYRTFCVEYRKEMLYPVLQSVARKYGQAEMYEGMISDFQPIVIPKGATEMEIRTKQVLKLLENLECHMITEVKKRLSKELSLVLAERAREEGALPTDLWKKPLMKESFTTTKPHIVENFISKFMDDCNESDTEITISKKHLNQCLSQLASDVMVRERSNYESYTMYYENLLRVHHQLLYQKEQELKHVQSQLSAAKANTLIEVQCELADQSSDLLLEITALRAKIAEMRQVTLTQERDVEERVRIKYDRLIKSVFSSAFQLKTKFDEFREDLHDDVYEKINETRREAIETMTKLKQRSGANMDDQFTQMNLQHSQGMREIQHENHTLNTLMLKMKAMNYWRVNQRKANTNEIISEIRKEKERNQKRCQEISMMAEQEVIQLRQQVLALRTALKDSQVEGDQVRAQLDDELKEKKEKSHEAKQRAQSLKQLEDAKKANVEKLKEELEDKEGQLRNLSEEQDKSKRMQQMLTDKVQKEVNMTKQRLHHERNLKLGAFQRVDQLQTQIYDIESAVYSRPQTAIGIPTSAGKTRKQGSRASSAAPGRTQRSGTVTSGNWPAASVWPANRSLTPAPEPPNHESKKIQRPKTTVGRLRSRIADQLLNELDPPDHHETLIRLKELSQQQQQQQQQSGPKVC